MASAPARAFGRGRRFFAASGSPRRGRRSLAGVAPPLAGGVPLPAARLSVAPSSRPARAGASPGSFRPGRRDRARRRFVERGAGAVVAATAARAAAVGAAKAP